MKNFGNKKWLFRGAVYVASAGIATACLPIAIEKFDTPIEIEAYALQMDVPDTFVASSPAAFSESEKESEEADDTEAAPSVAMVEYKEPESVPEFEPTPEEESVETMATPKRNWEQSEIDELIAQNRFTREDYEYLLSVAGECNTSYEGFHAVASCVMNRIQLNSSYDTVRQVVTAEGQFTAHNAIGSYTYNRLINQDVIDAAVNVLLGDTSSVGDSYYFFCRVNDFDLWVDGECSEFYIVDGNVFVRKQDYKYLHNKMPGRQADDILICDSHGSWQFESGSHYIK